MVTRSHTLRPSSEATNNRCSQVLVVLAALVSLSGATLFAQSSSLQLPVGITVEGTVRNSAGEPIAGASVFLQERGQSGPVEIKTKVDGTFVFSARRAGIYTVRAEKSGFRDAVADSLVLSPGEPKHVRLVLEGLVTTHLDSSSASPPSLPGAIEFEDKPTFTVAGVTDWTSPGGHGSDTSLRTSEALAKETLALKSEEAPSRSPQRAAMGRQASDSESKLRTALVHAPGSFEANHQLGEFYVLSERYGEAIPLLEAAQQINPGNPANAYDLALAYKAKGDFVRAREQVRKMLANADQAELHRLLGDLDERLDDPLGAVREYEQAARLDPSEQNYFEWGTELLLHRAARPAVEVFAKGAGAHPNSARMLAGLGVALYASGSYEEAARRLCDASDLKPADPAPYLFLAKMEKAAPAPLPCVEQKLARFVGDQPGNALALYYYAMTLCKRERGSENPAGLQKAEALLEKALAIDPKLDEAYLQLGILYSARGGFEQAIAAYKRAIETNPHLGEAHYQLGMAYKRIGEPSKAQQELQIYEQVEKTEAAAIERQRREIRQFLIVLKDQPGSTHR